MIQLQLLRNATIVVTINNKQLLVDPMLAPKDSFDPIIWTSNGLRNPLVELPVTPAALQDIIRQTDALLITHTHNDHWDEFARNLLPKNLPLLGQPEDATQFREQGFEQVIPVTDSYHWEGISIVRTPGHHGTGEIGEKMAPVSGFLLSDDTHTLYIAGDTIWCDEVADVIRTHQPDFIVVNAGGARFDVGDPIIMTAEDVLQVCSASQAKKIMSVHMEAINHCYLQRGTLREAIAAAGESARCVVPEDGEIIQLS